MKERKMYIIHCTPATITMPTRLLNKLPVGGVLIYDKIHFERINGAILDALAKLDPATYDSCLYNNTESDYTGAYQSMAIKKLA